jgi:hypothetical protein
MYEVPSPIMPICGAAVGPSDEGLAKLAGELALDLAAAEEAAAKTPAVTLALGLWLPIGRKLSWFSASARELDREPIGSL